MTQKIGVLCNKLEKRGRLEAKGAAEDGCRAALAKARSHAGNKAAQS